MTVALVDTSVFCNIVAVPGRSQNAEAVLMRLEEHIRNRVNLLLPVATMLETGNHIAHVSDGRLSRAAAQRFVAFAQSAMDNVFPWAVSDPLLDHSNLRNYLQVFPDEAVRGLSLGDLTIIKEYERQCEIHRDRRIFIWSLDDHLSSYDRPARL